MPVAAGLVKFEGGPGLGVEVSRAANAGDPPAPSSFVAAVLRLENAAGDCITAGLFLERSNQ